MRKPRPTTRPVNKAVTKSPCVRNCCLDEQDVCLGCGRTVTEIVGWSHFSDSEMDVVLQRAAGRLRRNERGNA